MSVGALVRAELERHDWAALRCGCGELDTLCHLVSGDSHATEQVLGRTRLGDECRARAREGYWLIARIGLTGSADDAETAADICELIDLDDERSRYYQDLLRERVSAKTKRRRMGWGQGKG